MSSERTERIQVIVSKAEKAALEQAAKQDSQSASSWLRGLGLKTARKAGVTISDTRPTV